MALRHVPPPYTQPEFNTVLDRLNGFNPLGTFRSPYSLLIDRNVVGGVTYYYACNAFQIVYGGPDWATTNGIDGTSAIAVINAARDALSNGGKIAIKAGTYPLTAKLSLDQSDNYVTFEGEGKGTILQLACNDDLIYICGEEPPGTAMHMTLSDMTLDGNKAVYATGRNALYVKHSMYNTYENLWIKNTVLDGVHFENAQRSVFHNVFIKDCDGEGFHGYNIGGETMLSDMWVGYSGLNGMLLDSANYVQGNNINLVVNGYNGLKLAHTGAYACSFNTFTNLHTLCNSQASAGTYDGVRLADAILGCVFNPLTSYDDQETLTQRYAFLEESSTSRNNKAVLVGSTYRNLMGRGYVATAASQIIFDELPNVFEDRFFGQVLSPLWQVTDADAVIALMDGVLGGGHVSLTTKNTIASFARLDFNGIRHFRISDDYYFPKQPYMTFMFKTNQLEECDLKIGLMHSADTYIALKYDSAISPNWYLITSNGGSSTSVDTGLAADIGWQFCIIDMFTPNRVNLYMNGIVAATVTTNIPTSFLEPVAVITTKENVSKVMEFQFINIKQANAGVGDASP